MIGIKNFKKNQKMKQLSTIEIPANNSVGLEYYKADDRLTEAVNIALVAERPLLLMGEPGVGKTALAKALAYSLHGEKYGDYFFEWNIKSQSKAKEGLYRFDALKRLQDAQAQKLIDESDAATFYNRYIQLGELAKAFEKADKNPDKSVVVLIDEVDKADVDFPNDLLLELDKATYTITETNTKREFKHKPLVIITSNQEKELPVAFLRRCIFHYIEMPDEAALLHILESRVLKLQSQSNDKQPRVSDTFLQKVVDIFTKIRSSMDNSFLQNEKKITTAELIDWFNVLYFNLGRTPEKDLEKRLENALNALENNENADLPYYQTLLKSRAMYHKIINRNA
jgi:MoxR-like ATPase